MDNSTFVSSLVEHGLLNERQGEELMLRYGGSSYLIACNLYNYFKLVEDRLTLGKLYGDVIGRAYIHLDKTFFQAAAVSMIRQEVARHNTAIPVYMLGDVLTVAMSEPNNSAKIKELENACNCPISPVFAFPGEIEDNIEIQYRSRNALESMSREFADSLDVNDRFNSEKLKEVAASSRIVEIVRGILLYSLKSNASDVHIQPTAKFLQIRYRIDGVLQTILELNPEMGPSIIARIKVLARCDVTERRLPQDGRLSLEMKGRSHDFRLSILPTIFGEKAVIRAIGQSTDSVVTPLAELALSSRNFDILKRLIKSPNGVLFVTGPTGSGKTTTLYSILAEMHQPEINIVTVEDPVEFRIDGISQVQTNSAIGLDFAKALRSILRQDPEVVLIGEIRDLETARIASQAALTGHLVMATMHTNNALQAVTRLIEIGVEPFLVAPSVIGVLAQRLVRRICEHCKEAYQPEQSLLDSLFFNQGNEQVFFYRGKGCEECNNTGYMRRVAIHELFILSDRVREMVSQSASIIDIQKESDRLGFKPLRYDGLMKVLQGLTTIEEVDRATAEFVV